MDESLYSRSGSRFGRTPWRPIATLCGWTIFASPFLYSQTKSPGSGHISATQALQLVQTGHCKEALPSLRSALQSSDDKNLKYKLGMGIVRCSMSLQDEKTVADTLFMMKRDFQGDPEVLYIATHYFSEMGMHASQELAAHAPNSYQARKLEAEAAESQGKNDEAIAIYRNILSDNPKTPGIHYRIGQVLLVQAGENGSTDSAKEEFQLELKIDPLNAASEFVLGELARRKGVWEEAVSHFQQASKLDNGFAEAYLALGMSFTSEGKFSDAVHPLEIYVAMQPNDPAGHYQLGIAYSRTGNKLGASQQMALQAKAAVQSSNDSKEGHAVR